MNNEEAMNIPLLVSFLPLVNENENENENPVVVSGAVRDSTFGLVSPK